MGQELKSIEVTGLKSLGGIYEFSPLTIIRGPNGSGKTAVLNAVELLARAELAEIGASSQKIFKLANDDSDRIVLNGKFDDGFELERDWISSLDKSGKPSIKESLLFTSITNDARKAVQKAKGEMEITFRPSMYGLNLKWFDGMSPNDRRKVLLDMIVASGASMRDDRPLSDWLLEVVEGQDNYKKMDADRVLEYIKEVVEDAGKFGTVLDKVRTIRENLQELLKKATEEMKAAENTIANLGFDKATIVDTSRIETLKAQKKVLNEAIEKLAGDIKVGEKDKEKFEEVTARIEKIRLKNKNDSKDLPTSDENKEAIRVLTIDRDQRKVIADNLTAHIKNIKSESKELATKLEAVFDSINWAKEIEADTECPTCASKVDPKKLIDYRNDEATDIQNSIAELEALYSKKHIQQTSVNSDLRDTAGKLEKVVEIRNKIDAHKRNADAANELEKEQQKILLPDMSLLNKSQEAKKAEREGIEAELETLLGAESQAKTYATCEANKVRLERDIHCIKWLVKGVGVEGIGGIIMKETVDPFIEMVNSVLEIFDPAKTFFVNFETPRGKETCEFGFIQNDVSRSYEAASGGEKMLIALALGISIVRIERKSTSRILLIDEIEHLDDFNFHALIKCCTTVIDEGWVDNIILAGVLDDLRVGLIKELIAKNELFSEIDLSSAFHITCKAEG